MINRRPKFRWSDRQIVEALNRPLPYDEDEIIIRDLAEFGALQILARREGGRKPRTTSARAEFRRLLISIIFKEPGGLRDLLPPRLRKTPTAPPTVRKVHQILGQCGWKVSEATVLKDVKKIGSRNLREARTSPKRPRRAAKDEIS